MKSAIAILSVLLVAFVYAAANPSVDPDVSADQQAATRPLVTPAGDGNVLVSESDSIEFRGFVGSRWGSKQLAAGIVTFPAGTSIPAHLHEIDEELIYVLEGELTVTLAGKEHEAGLGSTVFIPSNTWMAISNRGTAPARIFGVISRAEVDECFRVLYRDPHAKQVTPEELHALCRMQHRQAPEPD